LLRMTMPAEQVDAIGSAPIAAAAPVAPAAPLASAARRSGASPLVRLLTELDRRPSVTELRVDKGDTVVHWRRARSDHAR
jgi:hypothetical protein